MAQPLPVARVLRPAYYALDGTELADGSDIAVIFDGADLPPGVPLTVDVVVRACVEARYTGDLYEVAPSELPAWWDWHVSYLNGRRLPRPTSGRHLGSLAV